MSGDPLHVLLIQSWVLPIDGIRVQLREAGYAPLITRVDFEAALHAALSRSNVDILLHEPATPGLSRSVVESCLREQLVRAPLLELCGSGMLGARVRAALAAQRN